MILHHYDVSPYSEMIRLMLGYSNIPWSSAISPPMPPRPIVDPLVGGYRRIPVAQIGADIFCDTRIISAEIARLSERPQLKFENCSLEEQELVRRIGVEYFMAIVQTAKPSSVLAMLVKRYWPWQIINLMRDRANVAKTSKLAKVSRKEQTCRAIEFKTALGTRLASSDYLFGNHPTLSDFAAYHLLWFADLTRPKNFADQGSELCQWQKRMAAIKHGEHRKINKKTAFKAAIDNQPRALNIGNEDQLIGKRVSICPSDYALDSVEGMLVGADAERYVIRRETQKFGKLHIHLPKEGYDIMAV